ncbi:DUF6252 family protein [Dyadobacter arcticus]|uniref:DUF4397 domain-containing protein n=1 Tax=Dyadobacter arcticus TaxID=1078754 RepID=A0ABX0UFS8_9BACT|nr:DUF6252 family protein [Dyadobacter arcticus]NIJ51547.1 hypothetical protein [Dyadobacter arcticus]
MKTLQFFAALTFISLIGLTSCSKKSDDVTPEPDATVGFSVKVDGKAYAPDYAYALASFPGNDLYYAIYGVDSKTNDVVAIALPNTVKEGTVQINETNFAVMTLNKETFSTINGGTGTVTIKKRTATYVSGTFNIVVMDPTGTKKLNLTEGSFNVNVR